MNKHRIPYLACFTAFCFITLPLFSQVTYRVECVGQYPSLSKKKDQPVLQRLDNLVFGTKQEELLKPVSMLADSSGRMYILSQGSGKLLCFEERDLQMRDVFKGKSSFPSLVDACLLDDGRILFTDSEQGRVFSYSEKEGLGAFTSDNLQRPTGIAWSSSKRLVWVLETSAHRIVAYTPEGIRLKTIGCRGSGPGEFNFPTHIWLDREGKIFVVDALNFRVQIFSPEGDYLSEFGKQGNTSGFLSRPKGIASDSKGNVYLVDALFHTVQIFNEKGEFLYYFGGQGRGEGQFWMPSGIYIDRKDYIYVADTYNNRVQVFVLTDSPGNE